MPRSLSPAAHHVLEDAKRICAVPAPTFAEAKRAAFVTEVLEREGIRASIDNAGNVVCRFGPAGAATIFAAHLDTVFEADQPIEIREQPERGRVLAPGIGDNSLGVAALLHLTRRFRDRPPAAAVVLAATVGEEGLGDLRGAKYLLDTLACRAFVALEGGSLGSIETAGIGSIRYRATVRGRGGHSWSDRGTPSAVHGLVHAASRLLATDPPPGVARNIGRISGGTSINTIAAAASLELDLRAEDEARLAAAAQTAREVLAGVQPGLQADVELIGHRPSGAIAAGHPLLAAARRAREAAGLPRAREHASSTDANAAYGRGIPAITVGLTVAANAHRTDEYIETAPLSGGLAALERLADAVGAGLGG